MKRREFINWVGLGLISSYLPVALVACGEADTKSVPETTTNKEKLLSMGTTSELEESGYLLNKDAKVLVVKDREGKLMAVNPTCTHQGCTVGWETDTNQFVCPCHNAKYASDGKVLAKPAPSPLSTYEIQEENDEILVSLS